MNKPKLTGAMFDAIVKLTRRNPDTPSTKSARLVLVEGMGPSEAGRQVGASRSSVHIAVTSALEAHQTISEAYFSGGTGESKKGSGKQDWSHLVSENHRHALVIPAAAQRKD